VSGVVYRCVTKCCCYATSLCLSKCWLSEERSLPKSSTIRVLKNASPSNEAIIWLTGTWRRKERAERMQSAKKMGWIDSRSLPYVLVCFQEREYIIGIQCMPGRPHVSSLTAIWMESDTGGRHGRSQRTETALLHEVHSSQTGKSDPCNRPWRPIGLWDVEDPTFSGQSAHRWRWGCQPYAPAALYAQEDSW
jgi:hypothetical protein